MSEALSIERERALEICEQALAASPADHTEVVLTAGRQELTRFAGNQIHQNVAEQDHGVRVRAVIGKRIGVATSNEVSEQGVAETVEAACKLARLAEPTAEFISLPEPQQMPEEVRGVPRTAQFGPAERAEAVREVVTVAEEAEQSASGAFSVGAGAVAVANSLGTRAFDELTSASLRMVFAGDDSSGFAHTVSSDTADIDAEALARVAAEKCALSAHPVEVEPGAYDVVLEEEAVGDMVQMLGFFGFGAMGYQEERSPLCGRLGEKVCGESVSIWDDGLDERGLRRSFDFEGVPKQRVELITSGVAAGLVYDSFTAGRDPDGDKTSTGHAGPAPNPWGPMPSNLFVACGDADPEQMVASVERGLLVTRFHYTNVLHPKQSVLTGMTRDGTFLIEGGEIVGGVKNLRFTQSILEALGRVEMIGAEGKLLGGIWTPAMKIREFDFSGATEF